MGKITVWRSDVSSWRAAPTELIFWVQLHLLLPRSRRLCWLIIFFQNFSSETWAPSRCRCLVTTRSICLEGSQPGGAEPPLGGRAGQAEVQVGQRDVAGQGALPDGGGRSPTSTRRGREGNSATGSQSFHTRRSAGRTASQVSLDF